MAKEINIQAILTFQRYSPVLQGTGVKDIDQVNSGATHGISNVQKLTGGWDALALGSITLANNYYIFLKNLDTGSISVDLSLTSSSPGATNIFGTLRAQEFCLLPVKPSATIFAKSSSGTPDFLVVAVEA